MAKLHHPYRSTDTTTTTQNRPSTSQILAVVALFPIGGILLTLAALTLTGTLIGLSVAVPLLIIFSPVIVPAVLTVALAVAGFVTSGAFGITALSSIAWIVNYFRRMKGSWAEQLEQVGRHVQDTAAHVGQRVREGGHKAQDAFRP